MDAWIGHSNHVRGCMSQVVLRWHLCHVFRVFYVCSFHLCLAQVDKASLLAEVDEFLAVEQAAGKDARGGAGQKGAHTG